MRNAIELSMICLLFGVHPFLSGIVFVFCCLGRVLNATLEAGGAYEDNKSKQNQPKKP